MPARHASTPPVRRRFPFAEFKLLDEENGTFEGYLAVYSTEDWGTDIIDAGAATKTVAEAKARQTKRATQGLASGRYIWPIFWGHDDKEPIGGFTDAREDKLGIYVCGELDLDIEQGRRAYSGLKKGYVPGMSIGYFTFQKTYDRQGRRHLKEISIFEGSLTPIPMNDEALVGEVKTATGKSDWPLANRTRAWDNGAAHTRIVAWATRDDGSVDVSKLKSVHFYSPEGDDAENVSKYKLLFCDVIGGDVKACPKGIFACAGSHGVDVVKGLSADDKDAIRGKITSYYKRMASEFDDDSIKAPWDKQQSGGGKAVSSMGRQRTSGQQQQSATRPANLPQTKAADFSTTLTGLLQGDTLQREWAKTFDAFVSCMWNGLIDAKYPFTPADGSTPEDPQDALNANVDAFADQLKDLIARSIDAGFYPHLDDDGDSFDDPDDEPEVQSGVNGVLYDGIDGMSLDTSGAESKAGRAMSQANHKEMGAHLATMKKGIGQLQASYKSLKEFHGKFDPDTAKPGDDDPSSDDTTSSGGADDGGASSLASLGGRERKNTAGAGRQSGDTTPLTMDQVLQLIRERMPASRS